MRLVAMMAFTALRRRWLARYFLSAACAPGMAVEGASDCTHAFSSTCFAVSRFVTSRTNSFLTRLLACGEMESHHGEGKTTCRPLWNCTLCSK